MSGPQSEPERKRQDVVQTVALLAESFRRAGWAIRDDVPNPYAMTASHFDAYGAPFLISVQMTMQGRPTVTLYMADRAIVFNDRLFEAIGTVAAACYRQAPTPAGGG